MCVCLSVCACECVRVCVCARGCAWMRVGARGCTCVCVCVCSRTCVTSALINPHFTKLNRLYIDTHFQ